MIDDDEKLKRKWINKRVNATAENIGFNLTYDEFCILVEEAKLVSSDLGFTGNNYVLARYNDTGDYIVGNCRFITHKENMAEQTRTQAQENSAKSNAAHMNKLRSQMTDAENETIYAKIRNSDHHIMLRAQTIQTRKDFEATANQSYLGKKNSQFGTYWITDGESNKKWSPTKGELPDGFYKGRK